VSALVKSAELRLFASDGDVQEKLDAIAAKVDELKADNPELVARIDTAAASAKLQVLRDELKETAAAAGETGDEMDAAGDKMAVAGGKGEQSAGRMEGAWKVTKFAILGVGAALGYGIYKAAGFQSQMTQLHTQAGVATTQLKGLGAGVLQLAGQVGESPDSLAESLYHVESNFASLGIKGPKALDDVKIAAEGARVGGADLVDVTNALTAALASQIPGVKNTGQAMGALNAIVGAGDMKMQDLADAFGTGMVAVVKGYGLSLKDVGAALDVFGDNNIRGAKAGTDLRMAVQALAVPVSTGAAELTKLGLSTNSLADAMRSHGLMGALDLLQERFKATGVTAKQQGDVITTVFGKKAGVGLALLMDQMDRLKSKYPAITKGADDFGKAWADTKQTAGQQLKDLEMGSEALATSLGLKLLPAATKVMGWLSDFVNALERGSAGATIIAGVIGTVLAGIALKKLEDGLSGAVEGLEGLWNAGGKVVSFIGKMIGMTGEQTAATEAQTAATEEGTVAQEEADAAMDANPIGLIIIAIAALVIGIIEVVKHWKDFRKWGEDAWDGIKTAAVAAWHFLDDDVFHPIMKGVDALVDFVRDHWKLLATIVATVLLGPIAGLVVFVATHWNEIRNLTGRLVDDVANFFRELPGRIIGFLSSLPGKMLNIGRDIVMGLVHGIEDMFGDVAGAIGHLASLVPSGLSKLLSIFSPSRVTYYHGQMIGQGLIEGMNSMHGPVSSAAARLAMAATPAGYGNPGSGASRGPGVLQIEVTGSGSGLDAMFIEWLKNSIRVRGGGGPSSVQRALGQTA